jgi:hypothetical protein
VNERMPRLSKIESQCNCVEQYETAWTDFRHCFKTFFSLVNTKVLKDDERNLAHLCLITANEKLFWKASSS